MLSTVRYTGTGCIRSQRWIPPAVIYGVALALSSPAGSPSLPTLAGNAAILLPIAAWLTVATLNYEDPSQAAITASSAGGVVRAQTAKLLAALAGSMSLAVISIAAAYPLHPTHFGLRVVGVGLLMHFLTALGGVGIGSLCARPVIRSPGATITLVLLGVVTTLAVPHLPPVLALLALVDSDYPAHLATGLTVIAAETICGATLLAVAGLTLTRRAT